MERYKYPRTRHLPISRSRTDDDKIATVEQVAQAFNGRRVIITEKMDGESTTIYADGHSHARSIDSKFHPSRNMVRELAAQVAAQLPAGHRLCGENVYAEHSIRYDNLPGYFQLISMWNGVDCLPWDETSEWAELLDIPTVPVIYDGLWRGEEDALKRWRNYTATQLAENQESEGFVVRAAEGFTHDEFGDRCMKWVRDRHIQTDDHWMHGEVKANGLKQP